MSPEKQQKFLTILNEEELQTFFTWWGMYSLGHQRRPEGDWTTWLMLGGRGAGKTRAGAEWVRNFAHHHGKEGPIALIGETEHETREVMVEGVSGLLAVHHDCERPQWIPSRRRVEWRNGAVAQVFSAEDPESLRGPQFAAAWCDELAKWKRGYTNHPADPGGPTNFGITLADYRRYVKPGATAADVRAMRRSEACAIYKAHYWDALRCDELPAGLDYAVFDYGVNSGTGRAVKALQRLIGIDADGRMSDAVLALVAKRDAAELVAQLCDERLAFLKRLKTWPVFGGGWGRRVAEVRSAALTMARAEAARPPRQSQPEVTVPRGPARRRLAVGAVIAAAAAAAHGVVIELEGRPDMITLIVVGAIVAGYAASIFTWPWLRRAALGVEAEIDTLRARARALEARLRG